MSTLFASAKRPPIRSSSASSQREEALNTRSYRRSRDASFTAPPQSEAAPVVDSHLKKVALAKEARRQLEFFCKDNEVIFSGAGEENKPIEDAWSIEHSDANERNRNHATLRQLTKILRDYRGIKFFVRGEAVAEDHGHYRMASPRLAKYLNLDAEKDVDRILEWLANKRATAVHEALTQKGVPKEQLSIGAAPKPWRETKVSFAPEERFSLMNQTADLLPPPPEPYISREYRRTTVQEYGPRHLPPRQSTGLRNRVIPWAARDLRKALQKFPRLDTAEAMRAWLSTVAKRSDSTNKFETFIQLFCESHPPPNVKRCFHGEAPTTLADLLHFDCTRLSKLGVCTPALSRDLAAELETLRRIVTSSERRSGGLIRLEEGSRLIPGALMPGWLFNIIGGSVDGYIPTPKPLTWCEHRPYDPNALREARRRIEEILTVPIMFNGAGEDDLPSIIACTDKEQAEALKAYCEDPRNLNELRKMFPRKVVEVDEALKRLSGHDDTNFSFGELKGIKVTLVKLFVNDDEHPCWCDCVECRKLLSRGDIHDSRSRRGQKGSNGISGGGSSGGNRNLKGFLKMNTYDAQLQFEMDPNSGGDNMGMHLAGHMELTKRFEGSQLVQLSIEQSWNVDHTVGYVRGENLRILEEIAEVLEEYPELKCEIFGKTGKAISAPVPLAKEWRKHPIHDKREIMDKLARERAEACFFALVHRFGIDPKVFEDEDGLELIKWQGEAGKVEVQFNVDAEKIKLMFAHVPLRFVRVSALDGTDGAAIHETAGRDLCNYDGWRTLHLAINCYFDPLPDNNCDHSGPCRHRSPKLCDKVSGGPSVRSFEGKIADYNLSSPAVPALGGGPRGAYEDGIQSAFYSSTRTMNAHVGDARMGPSGWKTAALWAECKKHAESGMLLWCDACCLDQVAITQGRAGAKRYAESILAALEECNFLWIHLTPDYTTSIYTVLELLAWHTLKKTIHPTRVKVLNAMAVTSVSGRGARIPVFDPVRNHLDWLNAQYKKHGAVGREYAVAMRKLLPGCDVRDEAKVRGAFEALAAVVATHEMNTADGDEALGRVRAKPLPAAGLLGPTLTKVGVADSIPSFYAPEGHKNGPPEAIKHTTAWDYGWIGCGRGITLSGCNCCQVQGGGDGCTEDYMDRLLDVQPRRPKKAGLRSHVPETYTNEPSQFK